MRAKYDWLLPKYVRFPLLLVVVFNMLVLVGTVKMSDRVVREMMGL